MPTDEEWRNHVYQAIAKGRPSSGSPAIANAINAAPGMVGTQLAANPGGSGFDPTGGDRYSALRPYAGAVNNSAIPSPDEQAQLTHGVTSRFDAPASFDAQGRPIYNAPRTLAANPQPQGIDTSPQYTFSAMPQGASIFAPQNTGTGLTTPRGRTAWTGPSSHTPAPPEAQPLSADAQQFLNDYNSKYSGIAGTINQGSLPENYGPTYRAFNDEGIGNISAQQADQFSMDTARRNDITGVTGPNATMPEVRIGSDIIPGGLNVADYQAKENAINAINRITKEVPVYEKLPIKDRFGRVVGYDVKQTGSYTAPDYEARAKARETQDKLAAEVEAENAKGPKPQPVAIGNGMVQDMTWNPQTKQYDTPLGKPYPMYKPESGAEKTPHFVTDAEGNIQRWDAGTKKFVNTGITGPDKDIALRTAAMKAAQDEQRNSLNPDTFDLEGSFARNYNMMKGAGKANTQGGQRDITRASAYLKNAKDRADAVAKIRALSTQGWTRDELNRIAATAGWQ